MQVMRADERHISREHLVARLSWLEVAARARDCRQGTEMRADGCKVEMEDPKVMTERARPGDAVWKVDR